MLAALVLSGVLAASGPPGWGVVQDTWDGVWRFHTWISLRLMGFEPGPPAQEVVAEHPVAALPEEEAEPTEIVETVDSAPALAVADPSRPPAGATGRTSTPHAP